MTRRRDDRQSALDAAVESIEREGGEVRIVKVLQGSGIGT